MAAPWMSASQPRISPATPLGSTTSPATSSHPSALRDAARDGLRTRATTLSPRARSARATAPMTKPVAPVTNTFIAGILSRRRALRIRDRSHARAVHRTREPDERPRHQQVDRGLEGARRVAPASACDRGDLGTLVYGRDRRGGGIHPPHDPVLR